MLKFSMICYITESKHNNEQEVSQMLEVDDKAMAYYLIEALFAGGYIPYISELPSNEA